MQHHDTRTYLIARVLPVQPGAHREQHTHTTNINTIASCMVELHRDYTVELGP
jgi:hypothetical protein